ncbi:unnamed protein product [Symbiodinium sp. CCMP2592]|nr:unnamed protein product [Symbiodinium sp. CCMP2592]
MLVWLPFQPSPTVSVLTSPTSRSVTPSEAQAPARLLAHHSPPRCAGFSVFAIRAKGQVLASTTLHWMRVVCFAETAASVPVLGPLLAAVAAVVWTLLALAVLAFLGFVLVFLGIRFVEGDHWARSHGFADPLAVLLWFLCSLAVLFLLLLFPWPTLPICDSAPCPCANGFCHAAGDSCKGCFEGFHLSRGVCEANVCSCRHGSPVKGTGCTDHGSKICTSCSTGYSILNASCAPNKCRCPHGQPVDAGSAECTSNGAVACIACRGNFHLAKGGCKANQCTCKHGKPVPADKCETDGAEHCESCSSWHHLANGRCKDNACSCKHGVPIPGCARDGQESCQSCSSEFQLLGGLCVDSTCHQALEGAQPMAPIRHSEPSQADSPPPCASQSSYNGTCTIPTKCIQQLPASSPLRHAEAFAKGSPPFETHIPIKITVCVSAVLFVIPIIYSTATFRPFMLVVEVAISSADFGSDLLSAFNNDFYSWQMFVLAVFIVTAAGVYTIVWHYGGNLTHIWWSTYNNLAWISYHRLANNGIHQVFEIAGDSFEKHIINAFCAFFLLLSLPLLVLVIAPVVAALRWLMSFATGIVLHSTRLLLLKDVQVFYEKHVLGREFATSDTSDHVDPERYHTIILTEILTEGLPSTVLTLVNYSLMRQAYMVTRLNTVAIVSLVVSAYLVARIGFKYGHHMLYHGKPLADIPLPYTQEVAAYTHVGKNEVMAAGGAVAGVGGTAAALIAAG